MYLQFGTAEILLSDSELLTERAREAGVDAACARYEGMWHDFQLGAGLVPEADRALADLAVAIQDIWAGRPLAERDGSSTNGGPTREPSVAIIGGGFGGIGLPITLKKAGIGSLTILEKGEGVGGVWRDNTYPGAACDVPSQLYSFSFEPNPRWSRRYSPQPEILTYLDRCVDRYGLRPALRLGTEVSRAEFDEEAGRWRIETSWDRGWRRLQRSGSLPPRESPWPAHSFQYSRASPRLKF